jgi:hypothetical protein
VPAQPAPRIGESASAIQQEDIRQNETSDKIDEIFKAYFSETR